VNRDPLGEGWLFTIAPDDAGEFDALMSSEDYERWVTSGS
jgi:glycine cleavage system H lipoate-binding protein